MRVAALVLSILCAAGQAFASATAKPLNLPMSVRQMGMGDVSVAGDDTLRAWSNPALLGWQETRGEVAINGSSMFGAEASTMGLGGGWAFTPEVTGALLVSSYSVSFDEVDGTGASTGASLSQRSTAVGVGGAWRSGLVAAGGTVKFVSDTVGAVGASSVAADVGVTIYRNGVRGGIAYRNVGGKLGTPILPGISTDGLPGEFRAGVAYTYAPLRLTGGAEYSMPVDADGRAGLGVEWWPVPIVGVRAGMSGFQSAQRQLTFGLSAGWSGIGLDYAMGAHPLGPVHRFSLSYLFGAVRAASEGEATPGESLSAAPGTRGRESTGAKGRTVAVAPMDARGVGDDDAAALGELLRTELGRRRTTVVGRDAMEAAMESKSFPKKCSTVECAVKLGRLVGADVVVLGHFEKLLGRHFVNVRVVDVAAGTILATDVAKGDTVDALESGLGALAGRIAKTLK